MATSREEPQHAASPDGRQQSCLVPYLNPSEATGEVKQTLDSMPYTRNIFTLLGHSSGLYPPLMKVYQAAFNKNKRKLPLSDWQVIVLRIAARLDAPYPWDVNEPVASIGGVPQQTLDAMGMAPEDVQNDNSARWTPRQKAIVRLVDEQLADYNNGKETVEKLAMHLTTEEIVEVYIIIGVYCLIARITKGLKIDLDPEIPGLKESLENMFANPQNK